jgi:hypothetical protein
MSFLRNLLKKDTQVGNRSIPGPPSDFDSILDRRVVRRRLPTSYLKVRGSVESVTGEREFILRGTTRAVGANNSQRMQEIRDPRAIGQAVLFATIILHTESLLFGWRFARVRGGIVQEAMNYYPPDADRGSIVVVVIRLGVWEDGDRLYISNVLPDTTVHTRQASNQLNAVRIANSSVYLGIGVNVGAIAEVAIKDALITSLHVANGNQGITEVVKIFDTGQLPPNRLIDPTAANVIIDVPAGLTNPRVNALMYVGGLAPIHQTGPLDLIGGTRNYLDIRFSDTQPTISESPNVHNVSFPTLEVTPQSEASLVLHLTEAIDLDAKTLTIIVQATLAYLSADISYE